MLISSTSKMAPKLKRRLDWILVLQEVGDLHPSPLHLPAKAVTTICSSTVICRSILKKRCLLMTSNSLWQRADENCSDAGTTHLHAEIAACRRQARATFRFFGKPIKITVTRKNKDVEAKSLVVRGISMSCLVSNAKVSLSF